MFLKITKILLCLFLLGTIVSETQAVVTRDTGKIGFRLSNAGSMRLISTPVENDLRQLERVTIIAALSEEAVCDYNEDHDMVIESYEITPPTIADIEALAYYDNSYSDMPPDLSFKLRLYAWNDEAYLIIKYTVVNEATEQLTLYLGWVVVPRINDNYGLETDAYDATHQIAYCYRSGEEPHAGIRLLSKEPYSYKALDWSVYSPDDPNSDAATDSTRYHMTADTGFDTDIIAGGDGSIFGMNAGAYTLAAGDSVTFTCAIVYGNSQSELFENADAAKSKYDDVLVSVKENPNVLTPANFSLWQNYPNPFNPDTQIRFDLNHDTEIELMIYNVPGELVNTIASGFYPAGSHVVSWNGRDHNGQEAVSGVYIYHLTSGNVSLTKKMMLVK